VPQCAKRGKALAFLLVLLSACLNPRPEEFPSNAEVSAIGTPGSNSGDNNEMSGPPVGSGQEDPGYNIIGDGAGSGGDLGEPLPQTPADSSSGEGEPAAPDAGADAGAPSAELTGAEDTSTEGQAVP
jgi:hypothetical protein